VLTEMCSNGWGDADGCRGLASCLAPWWDGGACPEETALPRVSRGKLRANSMIGRDEAGCERTTRDYDRSLEHETPNVNRFQVVLLLPFAPFPCATFPRHALPRVIFRCWMGAKVAAIVGTL
jgi:hypothetical protein